MFRPRLTSTPPLLILCHFFAAPATCQPSTAIVTATTIITATVSGPSGPGGPPSPCDNFNGACVVYGPPGAVPYTTTVFAPLPSAVTATTSVTKSTNVPAESAATSACGNLDGACVVYGTDTRGSAPYTTTIHGGGGDAGPARSSVGNAHGYIGTKGGDGYIGAAGRVRGALWASMAWMVVVDVGAMAWISSWRWNSGLYPGAHG